MVTDVMLNLLQMKLADKTQALLTLDSGDRQLITVVSEIASHHMLQGLSEHGIWSVQAGQLRALWETSENKSSGGIKRSGGQYAAIADEADFNSKDLDSSESEESEDEVQVEVAEPVSGAQTPVPRSPMSVSYKQDREQGRAELQQKR